MTQAWRCGAVQVELSLGHDAFWITIEPAGP